MRGTCHGRDCRTLLHVPFHSVNALLPEQLKVIEGEENLIAYRHTNLNMKRGYCKTCGETLFNTNARNWKVVSQFLVSKNCGSILAELRSVSHFFYDHRVTDIEDELPKN